MTLQAIAIDDHRAGKRGGSRLKVEEEEGERKDGEQELEDSLKKSGVKSMIKTQRAL